jgi:ABC-type multidrug transport system ATPase subunit
MVLLDEPGTNLDTQGIEWYRELIERFSADRLVIIASNVKEDFDFCDHQMNILDYKTRK